MKRCTLMVVSTLAVLAGCIGGAEDAPGGTGRNVAATIQSGTITATGGQSNGQYWENTFDLPYGPPPGSGGSPSSTSDYGMCALQRVAGYFDAQAMVRIDLGGSNFYRITVRQGTSGRPQGSVDVSATWSCVALSDFSNAPSVTTSATTGWTTASSSSLSTHDQHSPSVEHACQWHGLSGALSDNDSMAMAFDYVDSFARDWTGGVTVVEATGSGVATLTSRGNCTYYTGGTTWTTAHTSSAWSDFSTTSTGMTWTGKVPSMYWCYLEGVARYPNSTTGGNGNITAAVAQGSHSGTTEYYVTAGGGGRALWNCLKLGH